MLLNSKSPVRAANSRCRLGQARVMLINGMAVSTVPMAYSVTNWPAKASETASPVLICVNIPAGMVSVSKVRNPANASASSAERGS